MKKLIFSLSILVLSLTGYAQSEAYTNGMKSLLTRMEASKNNPESYQESSNGFLRIAAAEKKEWLPNYYAAYCLIMQAMFSQDKTNVDAILDQADGLLSTISITLKNDEVMCLQAFSKSTRIGVDPMTRGMKYGMESAKFLEQAKATNAENPRIYFLQGQSAFYTPEQFGGGKAKALKLFQTALEKYNNNKPTSALMPNWGKEATEMMIGECSK